LLPHTRPEYFKFKEAKVDPLLTELHLRWSAIFSALVEGDDVPPALRLRTEGVMEAAVLSGVAQEEDILAAMAECYLSTYGRSLEDEFGAQWLALFPFPQIPAMAERAPVFLSTFLGTTD
jgi:hypothetical protein